MIRASAAAALVALTAPACGAHEPTPAERASAPNDVCAAAAESPSHADNADVVRCSIQPGLRTCYKDALGRNPLVVGRVRFALHLAPDGSVTEVTTSASDTVPPDLVACIVAVGRTARFAPPGPATPDRPEPDVIYTSANFERATPDAGPR